MKIKLDNLPPSIEMFLAIILSTVILLGFVLILYVAFLVFFVGAIASVIVSVLKKNKHHFIAERDNESHQV
jgi:hypothetical protein